MIDGGDVDYNIGHIIFEILKLVCLKAWVPPRIPDQETFQPIHYKTKMMRYF